MPDQYNLDGIRPLLTKLPGSRPFICKGKPMKRESIFIVGYNAATKLDRNFLEDWNDTTGFDFDNWIAAYKKERKAKGKRNELSNTRQRLESISKELGSVHVVETNIYNLPTANTKELKKAQKNSEIFEMLVQELKPRTMIIHGTDALKKFNEIYKSDVKSGEFKNVSLNGISTKVKAVKHFSRGWGNEKIMKLCEELKAQP